MHGGFGVGEDSKGMHSGDMVCGRSRDAVIDGVMREDVVSCRDESSSSCFGIPCLCTCHPYRVPPAPSTPQLQQK
jgi:hypothetical protein